MIDRLCDLSPVGEIELRAGWLRHRVRANWKIAAENVCDFYHPQVTHASSGLTDVPAGFFSDSSGAVTRDLGNGHGEVDYRPARARCPGEGARRTIREANVDISTCSSSGTDRTARWRDCGRAHPTASSSPTCSSRSRTSS